MHVDQYILADHDDSFIKLIIFAVIALIWAIQAIANVAKNANRKKQQQLSRRAPQVVPPPVRVPTPMAAPRPKPPVAARTKQARAPVALRPRPVSPRGVQPMPSRPLPPLSALAGRAVTARLAQPAPATARAVIPPAAAAAPVSTTAKRAGPAVTVTPGSGIARWLDRRTVRSQFLLAEALQPPLALRTRSHLP